MNRQFYEEEIERKLSPFALNRHGFWDAFIKLSNAYLAITDTLVPDDLTFNTDLEVWNDTLSALTAHVDSILQYENNGQDRLEEFEDLVSALEYIFEEAAIIQPKDTNYVLITIDCDVFEALLNTDIEFRFVDTDRCPSEVEIFVHTQDPYEVTLTKFKKRVDHVLFNLIDFYLIYPNYPILGQISIKRIVERNNIYRSILFDYLNFEFVLEAEFDGSYTLYASELPAEEKTTTIDYDTASNPRKLKAVMDRIIAI